MREFSTFVELLRFRAASHPDTKAFVFLRDGEDEDKGLTYGELDRQARAIAASLQERGASGERALLLYSPNLDFITAFWGCLYAGVLAVPAYPPRPNQTLTRLRAIMEDSAAKFALTTDPQLMNMGRLLERNPDFATLQWVTTDTLRQGIEETWEKPSVDANTLAFLQYTSGSTGTPKGVMVSHGNLMHNARFIRESFQDSSDSTSVCWLPPYHDMGLIGGVIQPIYLGSLAALMSPVSFLQRPFRWLKAMSRYRAKTGGGPNFAYDLCARQITPAQRDLLDLSAWTLAFSGAEPVRAETLDRFAEMFAPCGFRREAFYPCYGMAEATLFITGGDRTTHPTIATIQSQSLERNHVVMVSPDGADKGTDTRQLVSCGRCHPDQTLLIVHPETHQVCNEHDVGEIWVTGDGIAQGYWNRQQQSHDAFHATIASSDGESRSTGANSSGQSHAGRSFLRTGDLGFLSGGELFIAGRIKDVIIIRGLNHYPQDIELTVDRCHAALRQGCSAAFAIEVDGQERLVIVQEVERRSLRRLNVNEVTQSVRQAIAEQHQLQAYAVVLLKTGTIPKTSSGKIRRHACKAGFSTGTLDVVGQWQEVPVGTKASGDAPPMHSAEPDSQGVSGASSAHSEPFDGGTLNKARGLTQALSKRVRAIQRWLVAKLSETLNIPGSQINIYEPFARYGLDSVTAIRLSAELEDWLGRALTPTVVYDYPTIASLADYLSAPDGESDGSQPDEVPDEIKVSPPHESDRSEEAIAIVGMGCRFPGADNLDAFWQLLHDGREAISTVSDRWTSNDEAKVGGFLEQVDYFDPQFFGISPREAIRMDPQQRLLLEVSWEAFEHAGIAPSTVVGSSTGVFVGVSNTDYAQLQVRSGSRNDTAHDPYSGTGNAHSIIANRLSYIFDLRGPSLAVDTACSSSLVAVHMACQHLQQGDCDQAIVGGVNLILSPDLTTTFAQAGMMAPDGRCKTFDASADGYVRSEGCGVVILKPLSAAVRDGDMVLAVVKGSAVNQDGRSNGLTAPNGPAQQSVVRQALRRANVTPDQVSYVDAHGTGTPLGDPIELNSLKTVLMQGRSASSSSGESSDQPCWVGSVKTNIGHLESAAGIAGLIKTVLALHYQEIPQHLHFQSLNPHINLAGTPIQIPTQRQPWVSTDDRLRVAGVSSFGFGGTNAHVVLAEAPSARLEVHQSSDAFGQSSRSNDGSQTSAFTESGDQPDLRRVSSGQGAQGDRPRHLITLSAKSEAALRSLAQRYTSFLTTNPDVNLADIGYTTNTGRSHLTYRLAISAMSISEVHTHLEDFIQQGSDRAQMQHWAVGKLQGNAKPRIAFLFTGQGAQYVNMGRELYETQPIFRDAIHQCDRLLRSHLAIPLVQVLYPDGRDSSREGSEGDRTDESEILNRTEYTQPALFAVEYALAQLWMSWGIQPDGVIGHSVGEYVAACVAGVFSLDEGLALMSVRSRLMQALPSGGAMVAVLASESQVRPVVARYSDRVDIAAINGARNIVISGEQWAVRNIVQHLETDGIEVRSLHVSHAFHSSLMEPMLDEFRRVAETIHYAPPQIPLISNLTGQIVGEAIATADYWCRHVRQPVQFATGIETLTQEGYHVFLEIGPKATLCGMGRQHFAEVGIEDAMVLEWLPSLRSRRSNWSQILDSLGKLYAMGVEIDWRAFDQHYDRQRLMNLPTYPWQRQRYWFAEGWEPDDEDDRAGERTQKTQALMPKPPEWLSWLYHQRWIPCSYPPILAESLSIQHAMGLWVVMSDPQGLGDEIAAQIHALGQTAVVVYPGDRCAPISPTQWQVNPASAGDIERVLNEIAAQSTAPVNGIIHSWGLENGFAENGSTDDMVRSQQLTCQSALAVAQTLAHWPSQHPAKLWIVTRNAVFVDVEAHHLKGNDVKSDDANSYELCGDCLADLNVAGSPLWGFSKVLTWEHPERWGGIIDLDAASSEHVMHSVAQQMVVPDAERWLAIRRGQRYTLRLAPLTTLSDLIAESAMHVPSAASDQPTASFDWGRSKTTYLITGGLGALGLSIAEWMVQKGATHVTLMSRRSPSEAVQQRLDALRQSGADLLILQADVTQAVDVAAVLASIQGSGYDLRGVIHAAGVLKDGVLVQQTWDQFRHVMAPKILGAWNLHQATQDVSLDFFVLFSSVASLLGSPGQVNYAAANSFLDALAAYRVSRNCPALSLNWGPWDMAGMANDLSDRNRNRLALSGIDAIAPEVGLEIFSQLIQTPDLTQAAQMRQVTQIGVAPIRWEDMLRRIPSETYPSYLADMAKTIYDSVDGSEHEETDTGRSLELFEQCLQAKDEAALSALVLNYVKQQCALVLQLNAQQIQSDDNLLELGMDSLMVMEAMNQVRQDLRLMLYPREFYERPRLDHLAQYLVSEFERIHVQEPSSASTPQTSVPYPVQPLTLFGADAGSVLPAEQPDQKLPGIVFILSSPRSGSTLLRVMLAGHPTLFAAPELHLLPFNTLVDRDVTLTDAHLNEGLQRTLMELKHLDAASAEEFLQGLVRQNTSTYETYRLLQTLSGDRLLIDKSPTYAIDRSVLDRAEILFDQAKYIHLVRHPYAVIESFVRMRMERLLGQSPSDPHRLAEQVWRQCNENIREFLQGIDTDRTFQLTYEDLVLHPKSMMEKLCTFLEVPFRETMLNPYGDDRMTDGVHTSSLSVGDPNFLYHGQLRPELASAWQSVRLPYALEKPTQILMDTLGYEHPGDRQDAMAPLSYPDSTSAAPASVQSTHGQRRPSSTLLSPDPVPVEVLRSEQMVDVRGLPLCLCIWGNPDHPLVLCLHGILEQGAVWEPVAQFLAHQGYYVVAPDLRGHGRSAHVGQGGSYHLLDFLSDVDAVVQHLMDDGPCVLVGHSMGSILAALFTSLRPQRVQSLILVETILPSDESQSDTATQLTTHLDYLVAPPRHITLPDLTAAAERLRQATPTMTQEQAIALAKRIIEPYDGGVRWRWDPLLRTRAGLTFNNLPFGKAKYIELTQSISVPVTLVYGNQSTFNRPEDLQEQAMAFPAAHRFKLDGGHNVHLESAHPLADIIVNAMSAEPMR